MMIAVTGKGLLHPIHEMLSEYYTNDNKIAMNLMNFTKYTNLPGI